MSIIFLLIAASALVALIFLGLFITSVRQGQFDDTWSPARRMLVDDDDIPKKAKDGRTGRDQRPAGPKSKKEGKQV